MSALRFLMTAAFMALVSVSATAQPAKATHACALLSRQGVEEVLGAPVSEGQSRVQNGTATSCRFAAKDGGVVSVLLRRLPHEQWASQQADKMQRSLPNYREVPGLGDRSFLYDMGATGAAMCVFRAGYYLQVSVFRIGDGASMAPVLEKLARQALDHF